MNSGVKFGLALTVFFIFSAGFTQDEKLLLERSHPSPQAELDSFFQDIMKTYGYVGLGACLIKDGAVIWDSYYGYASLEEGKLLKRESIFPLASLSKTFTAFTLMTLLEQKKFQLDDDINSYMPFAVRNPHFPETPLTFRMLLTHTWSFEDVTQTGLKVPQDVGRPPSSLGDSEMSLEVYIRELLSPDGKYYSTEYFSQYTPGTHYSYSNVGYALLGYLVEMISEQDFSDYSKSKIFQPLRMKDTGWHLRDLALDRVIYSYRLNQTDSSQTYQKIPHFGEPGYPSGMLRTTMPDFARFLCVLINEGRYDEHHLLQQNTVDNMLSPQYIQGIPSRIFQQKDISLGWLITAVEGEELYSMNGFSGGIFTNAYFSRTEDIGIIYYYTGINMQNMAGMESITKKMLSVVRTFP